MNRRDAELLCIRAIDGELTRAEKRRLDELLATEDDLRAFYEAERAAAADADAAGAMLRLPGNGLEEPVLRRLGMRSSRSRRWLLAVAGVAAAAVVGIALFGGAEKKERAPAPVYEETARFAPVSGAGAEAFDDGAYRLAEGTTSVEVEKATVIETSAGVIELRPGAYKITVAKNRVQITVEKGRAVLRNDSERVEAKAGETRALARETTKVAVEFEEATGPAVLLTGRVLDGSRGPVEGARIWVSKGVSRDEGDVVTRTDADGRFRVENLRGRVRFVGARAAGFAPSDLRMLETGDQTAYEMEIQLTNPGSALTLTVVGLDGAAVPGARVLIGSYYRNLPVKPASPDGYRLNAVGPRVVTTDAAGKVSADGLPPEWNSLRVVADGFAPFDGYVRLPPKGHVERTQRLGKGAALVGTVRDTAGAPVPGAVVRLRTERSAKPLGVEIATDAAGAFAIPYAPLGKIEVTARAPDGREASAWVRVKSEGENRWDAVIDAALSIRGVVRYADGEAVPFARVSVVKSFTAVGDRPWFGGTDKDGRFHFDEARDAEYEVQVWQPGKTMRFEPPVAKQRCSPADKRELELEIPRLEKEREPALVRGTVVRADGAAAVGAWVKVWPMGRPGWNTGTKIGGDGVFELGPVAPGKYQMEVHLDGEPTLHLRDIELEPGRTKDMGGLRFAAPAHIRAEVFTETGEPAAKAFVMVASMDQRIFYSVKAGEGGTAMSEGLTPGRYLVMEGGTGLVQAVEIVAGETKTVRFDRKPPRKVKVAFTFRDGGAAAKELKYRILTPDGWWIRRDTLHAESETIAWLTDGEYVIEASDDKGREAKASIVVTASSELITVVME